MVVGHEVVVVVRHEGAGGQGVIVIVMGERVREQRWWMIEQGGWKWAGGL
jgi:hypothetical protein